MIDAVEHYIRDIMDPDARVIRYADTKKFPLFLRNSYRFYLSKILDTPLILLAPVKDLFSASEIQKHLELVRKIEGREVAILLKEVSQFKRRSLLAHRIPFIVEGNQIFLPFLGLLLSKAPMERKPKQNIFSLSAQLAFLYFLYGRIDQINATQLAVLLKMTIMTASRVLNELLDADLVSYEVGGKTGKSKVYRKIQDPLFFTRGKDFLLNPVRKTVFVKEVPPGALMSGMEALAHWSMLNPPGHRVLAVGSRYLEKAKPNVHYFNEKDAVDGGMVLEVWKYPPELFACQDYVDLASLYACLKDEKDERVQQALDEALRGEPWYGG